jgi:hypothetical protein
LGLKAIDWVRSAREIHVGMSGLGLSAGRACVRALEDAEQYVRHLEHEDLSISIMTWRRSGN